MERDPESVWRWRRRTAERQRDRQRAGEGFGANRQPLPQQSEKRKAERPERQRVWKAVQERDKGCRIAPFLPDDPCMGPLTPHHLKKASAVGAFTEDNIIAACAHHNDWVEDNPIEAEALGLVIR